MKLRLLYEEDNDGWESMGIEDPNKDYGKAIITDRITLEGLLGSLAHNYHGERVEEYYKYFWDPDHLIATGQASATAKHGEPDYVWVVHQQRIHNLIANNLPYFKRLAPKAIKQYLNNSSCKCSECIQGGGPSWAHPFLTTSLKSKFIDAHVVYEPLNSNFSKPNHWQRLLGHQDGSEYIVVYRVLTSIKDYIDREIFQGLQIGNRTDDPFDTVIAQLSNKSWDRVAIELLNKDNLIPVKNYINSLRPDSKSGRHSFFRGDPPEDDPTLAADWWKK